MLLLDKVAIVTGAARGIGRAVAERLSREGAKVVVADVLDDDGAALVAELKADGRDAMYRSTNVAERLDVHNLVAVTHDAYGRIDVLVNNAGIVDDGDFLTLTEDEFDRILETNLKGTFLVTQAVAKRMIEQAEGERKSAATQKKSADGRPPSIGAIVNMSSVNAIFGLAEHVAYAVSKGGQMQLTKSTAIALAPYGIRVNAVGPGTIETDLSDVIFRNEEQRGQAIARTPMGRFGQADEIAGVVAWLASEQASYLTGTTIWADGGRLALNTVMPLGDDS